MKRGAQRSVLIRNLFNPAFCALVIFEALSAYQKDKKEGLPFSLSLLILPICFSKEIREKLLKTEKSYLTKAGSLLDRINQFPEIRRNFAKQVENWLPFTLEGLDFLGGNGACEVTELGCFRIYEHYKIKSLENKTEDLRECIRVARALGGQFAKISDQTTIYSAFGIRP